MDLRNLLQTMLTLNEGETKETTKGREHKGTYGTSHGKEDVRDQYGHKIGKVNKDAEGKKDAPKKGRGRPKKGSDDSGEVKSYDTKSLGDVFGGGKKPSKEVGKKSVKHSLKDWIESVETNTLNEDGQYVTKPIPQQATQLQQVIGPDGRPALNQPIPTSAALRVANALSSSNGTQGMAEDGEKKTMSRAAKGHEKYGKEGMQALAKAGRNGAGEKKLDSVRKKYNRYDEGVAEAKDLPGKQEKLDVAKPKGKLDANDFAALRDKKKKVAEARVMEESEYTYEKIGKILSQENPTLDANSDEFASAVYHEMIQMGMTPKSAHNKLSYDEDFLSDVASSYAHYIKHGMVDEEVGAGRGVVNPPVVNPNLPTPPARTASPGFGSDWKPLTTDTSGSGMGSIKSGTWQSDPKGRVKAPMGDPEGVPESSKASGFLKSLSPFSMTESKNMKDIQLENWEKELNSLLNEGITVSSSTGQQGSPDSVSINATDADAQELLAIVRQAGLGVFGGDKPQSNYGAPMHDNPEGHGTEPEMSPAVVGDDSDMLALIKKMTGIDMGMGGEEGSMDDGQSSDYEDEEGHDSEEGPDDTALQPAGDEESEEGGEEQDSGEESDEEEEIDETREQEQHGQLDEIENYNASYTDFGPGINTDVNGKRQPGPSVTTPDYQNYKTPGLDSYNKMRDNPTLKSWYDEPAQGFKGATNGNLVQQGAWDRDARGQRQYVDRTAPGIVNKIKDKLGYNMPDQAYGPKPDETQRLAKRYPAPVKEDDMEEGNAFTGKLKQTPKGGEFKMGDKSYKDTSSIEEGEETCNECGSSMYEGHECGTEAVEEGYANETGHEELAQLKALLSMGNDMHRPKNSQATGNIQKVTMETKLMKQSSDLLVDFRKLSGIK